MTLDAELAKCRNDLATLSRVVGTLIVWMAQSANSPIRREAAEQLLAMLPELTEK